MNEVKRYKLLQSVCYDDGAFVIPAGQVMVTASAHDDVVQALRAENARLKEALVAVVKLVDDGLLVRNVANDHMEGWGIRALPIVQALQQANDALQPKEAQL